jgi:dihydroneopterin aldolase
MHLVFLKGLEVYGYHGASAAEREVGHRLLADISLEVEGSADETDRIADTANYAELGARVTERISSVSYATLERLAADVCRDVLKDFPLVRKVTLTLSKPHPPMPHIAAFAGIEVSRERP